MAAVRRRIAALMVGLLMSAVLLELVLQCGALMVFLWFPRHEQDSGSDPERLVLCVGDSFTYGLGASSPDASYPMELARQRSPTDLPWQVVNGGWPGRTSRDVLLELPGQLRALQPAKVCILVGTNDVLFLPSAVTDAELASARPGFRFEWRTRRLLAVWLGAAPKSEGHHEPSGPATDPLEANTVDPRSGPDRHPGTALPAPEPPEHAKARALLAAGQTEQAFEVAVSALETRAAGAFDVLVATATTPARRARVMAAVSAVLTQTGPELKAPLHEILALLQRNDDPDAATLSLLDAIAFGGTPALLVGHLQAFRDRYGREQFERLLEQRPAAEREPALSIYRQALEGAGPLPVLERHLMLMVQLCREAGAEPILVTYPRAPGGGVADCQRSVARSLGVRIADAEPVFTTHLRQDPPPDLFIPDGHCNDHGYALLAEVVGELLRR